MLAGWVSVCLSVCCRRCLVWSGWSVGVQGAPARDSVLNAGALRPLVQCIQRHGESQQILRIGSWAINNLCDGQVRQPARHHRNHLLPSQSGHDDRRLTLSACTFSSTYLASPVRCWTSTW